MLGDTSRKKCIYSIGKQSLPIMDAVKEKIDYCRRQPVVNETYVIEHKTSDEFILSILCEIIHERTGEICSQESVVIRLIYKNELNDLSVEAVVTHLCAYSTGEYSLHGVFRQVKDDV